MRVKTIGLKTGSLAIVVLGMVFYIGLSFSRVLIPVFPIITGLLVWYKTSTQRKLIGAALTPIYEIAEGWVKVQGTVSASKVFETPYFKEKCIAYQYRKANISYDSEDGTERENNAVVEEEFQDFYLTNQTGKIKVTVNKLNIDYLPARTDTLHSVKYAVDDVRHTERALKNGDLVSVMGYAEKNSSYQFELNENGSRPLVIATPGFEDKTKKLFQLFKHLMPYLILMYLAVNYFLFFAPVKQHVEKSTAFALFSFFGIPLLGVLLGVVGNRFSGIVKDLINGIAGICFFVSLLSFPLLCLLFITETEFYVIECVWLSVLVCITLAFTINYRKISGAFDNI